MKNVRFSQMNLEDRKKYNAKLIGILQKIMTICEDNHIRWFVGYGGCIGAIRHKGCIPWDDDIDICMPRPDYDRFVEICKETCLGDYELAIIGETPDYFEHIVRFYDKNSTILFTAAHAHVSGIFIDIFPLDGAADGKIDSNYKRYLFWQKLFHQSHLRLTKSRCCVLLKDGNFLALLFAIIMWPFRTILQRISERMLEKTIRHYSYEDSEYCTFYNDVSGMKSVIPKAWVEETIFVPFESVQVRIPKYYHKYLTHIYGDYMTPPPIEERDDRHVFAFVDMEKRWSLKNILSELTKDKIKDQGK